MINLKKAMQWFLSRISPHYSKEPDLIKNIEESVQEWKLCRELFSSIDPEMLDYIVFRLNAAERRYMTLLAASRQCGLKAWPDNLKSEVRKCLY